MSSYLTELYRFYTRLSEDPSSGMPPQGMSSERISFVLVISENGDLVSVNDIRDSSGNAVRRVVPAAVNRSSNVVSDFLWGNTGYVLGVDGKGKPQKTIQTADAFKEKHRSLLNTCTDIHATALLSFLEKWNSDNFERLELKDALLDSNVVFQLEGDNIYLHEIKVLKDIWLASLEAPEENSDSSVCLITGDSGGILKTHPLIKGVVGAKSSGAALVSFNCPSFTSYGKEQNTNAPVSGRAARGYTSALNYLLRRENGQMVRVGDTCIVFWAERPHPVESMIPSIFNYEPPSNSQDKGQLDRLEGILKALRTGNSLNGADKELSSGARFFILGLAPNAARISVRFWLADTLEILLGHLVGWYNDLKIERHSDSEPEFPPLWMLLVKTVAAQEKTENIPPMLAGQMAYTMLSGAKIPPGIYASILQRIYTDKKVGYFRASLIKAYLCRNANEEKDMSTINKGIDNVGYRLGRVFALLEKAQEDALGKNIGSSLRDRYIGAASATPRLIFPSLLRLAQYHVTKAKKQKFDGYEAYFSQLMGEILENIGDFPAVLSLEDQGRFMLGYYHQNNELYKKK